MRLFVDKVSLFFFIINFTQKFNFKEVIIMKRSKFVAMLLVFALMFGSLSTALAFTDNTQLQLYDYAKNNVKYRASATTIGLIGRQ